MCNYLRIWVQVIREFRERMVCLLNVDQIHRFSIGDLDLCQIEEDANVLRAYTERYFCGNLFNIIPNKLLLLAYKLRNICNYICLPYCLLFII